MRGVRKNQIASQQPREPGFVLHSLTAKKCHCWVCEGTPRAVRQGAWTFPRQTEEGGSLGRNLCRTEAPALWCQKVVWVPENSLWQALQATVWPPREMLKRQSWVYQQMGFIKTHIRCKGANRSSGFEASPNTSRHEESLGSTTDTEHLESSVPRESRSQPILTSTPASTDSKILEHFDQMRTLISGFLQQKSDRQPFFDYVASEAEKMTQEEFEDLKRRIFRDIEAVKNNHRCKVLPKRSATITRESQKVGILPTTTQQASSSTQAAADSSSSSYVYYTPSPIVSPALVLYCEHWWRVSEGKPSISAHSTGWGQEIQLKWNTKSDTRSNNTDHWAASAASAATAAALHHHHHSTASTAAASSVASQSGWVLYPHRPFSGPPKCSKNNY